MHDACNTMKRNKIRKNKRYVTRGLAAVAFFALFFQCIWAFPANIAANDNETLTLSGTITENVEVLPGTNKVILKDLVMKEPAELIISTPVEIEIAEGSKNSVCILEAMYDTKLTGGGNLDISLGILEVNCRLMFSHTGTIKVGGPVAGDGGSIVINSGTLDFGSGLSIINGPIIINGGTVNVVSEGTAISTYGPVTINGGNVNASSTAGPAIVAGTGNGDGIELSENVNTGGGLTVQPYETENGVFAVLGNESLEPAAEAVLEGPADENSISQYDKEFAENSKAARQKALDDKAAQEKL